MKDFVPDQPRGNSLTPVEGIYIKECRLHETYYHMASSDECDICNLHGCGCS